MKHFFLLKIQNWNLYGNLGALLVLLESPWWEGFNEGDLEIFQGDIEIWVIFLSLEISIKLPKIIGFEREKNLVG